jgi:hypothetical protein
LVSGTIASNQLRETSSMKFRDCPKDLVPKAAHIFVKKLDACNGLSKSPLTSAKGGPDLMLLDWAGASPEG